MSSFVARRSSALALALLVLAGALGAGCGSFNRAWKTAGQNNAEQSSLIGRWEGSWKSDVNGHSGKLRCLVSDQGQGMYRARFHAKYRTIFSFGYTVPLRAEKTEAGFSFRGEANLGWYAGGSYTYEGQADRTNFYSTYGSKQDHGSFTMNRP